MLRRIAPLALTTALLAAAIGGACYEDDSSGPATSKPMAKVFMTDAPFPFDTVQSVDVYVVSVAASTEPDTGSSPDNVHWVTITEPKKRIDLLTLQQGTTTLLGEGEIPADRYRAVRVIIDVDSSGISFVDGSPAVVHWGGSGQQAIHAFVEAALDVLDEGVDIVIDFDVGRSFHYNDFGDGSFNFFPWIRAVNAAATGSIAGTVLGDPDAGDPAPIQHATVSAYGADQGTWQVFSTVRTDASGRYRLAYLLPGTYIVQTDAPRSGGWTSNLDSSVVVTRGVETDHSVTLTPFRGSVTILGAAFMFVGRTNELEAVVVNAQNQREPDPVVAWDNLNPAVLSLTDSGRAGQYAWVTALTVGSARIIATSGVLSDTLLITVVPDSSQGAAMRARAPRH